MEGDQCSRCLLGSLTVDEQEGFLLCPNCGFVADEVHLVNNPLGGEGVTVGDHVAGGGAALMSGSGASGFGRGIGTAPSSGFGQNRGRREAVDRLRGVASRLMLPAGVVQEAVSMFHEVKERKLLRTGADHYTVDAQIAAVLFTVIRSQNQPMALSEVANACQASPIVVGRHFRTLASALCMPALLPSATIRAFAMRLAAKLLESLNCDQGPRGQHPFLQEAVAVTDLVAKLGVGEGRPPVILAAASLLWVAESGVSKKYLPSKAPFAQVLSAAAGCNIASVQGTRKLVAHKVLQIALLLPMSTHFTEANLLHYFPLVASLVHTLAALRRTSAAIGMGALTNISASAASMDLSREASRINPSREDPSMHPSRVGLSMHSSREDPSMHPSRVSLSMHSSREDPSMHQSGQDAVLVGSLPAAYSVGARPSPMLDIQSVPVGAKPSPVATAAAAQSVLHLGPATRGAPAAAKAAPHRTLGTACTLGTGHSGPAGGAPAADETAPRVQRSTRAKRRRGGSSWGESWRAAALSDQGDDGSMDLQQQQQQQQQLLDDGIRGGSLGLSPISWDAGAGGGGNVLQGDGTAAGEGSKRQRRRQQARGAGTGGKEEQGGRLSTAELKKEEAIVGAGRETQETEDGVKDGMQRRSHRTRRIPHWMRVS